MNLNVFKHKFQQLWFSVNITKGEKLNIVVVDSWRHRFLVIKAVLPNGVGERLGLNSGDRIAYLNGVLAPNLNLTKMKQLIENRMLTLCVLRKHGSKSLTYSNEKKPLITESNISLRKMSHSIPSESDDEKLSENECELSSLRSEDIYVDDDPNEMINESFNAPIGEEEYNKLQKTFNILLKDIPNDDSFEMTNGKSKPKSSCLVGCSSTQQTTIKQLKIEKNKENHRPLCAHHYLQIDQDPKDRKNSGLSQLNYVKTADNKYTMIGILSKDVKDKRAFGNVNNTFGHI